VSIRDCLDGGKMGIDRDAIDCVFKNPDVANGSCHISGHWPPADRESNQLGLLRMADLLALQPNMDIRLHIVAPTAKREKVFQEIRRPVFSLLERGPLSELCTYLSYDGLRDLAEEKHLSHLSDSVLDEYAEEAE